MLHNLEDKLIESFKKPNIVRLLFIGSLFLIGWGGYYIVGLSTYKETTESFCSLINDYFVSPVKGGRESLIKNCNLAFRGGTPSKAEWLKRVQPLLDSQSVSHFYILTPSEYKEAFSGEATSNGFELLALDGRFFVIKMDPNGVAAREGVQFGDQLIMVNGSTQFSRWAINEEAEYEFLRGDEQKKFHLKPEVFKLSKAPLPCRAQSKTGYLKVETFTEGAFDRSVLKNIFDQCGNIEHLVLDLRGNRGGDIENMILLGEYLDCKSSDFGAMVPSNTTGEVGFFGKAVDELVADLKSNKKLTLKRVHQRQCFDKKMSILVDGDTGSAAEMLASHLRGIGRAKIYGNDSSGEVVLSGIFELSGFMLGSFISMPIGLYDGPEGPIEGKGLEPDEYLRYTTKDLRRGVDSWLKRFSL